MSFSRTSLRGSSAAEAILVSAKAVLSCIFATEAISPRLQLAPSPTRPITISLFRKFAYSPCRLLATSPFGARKNTSYSLALVRVIARQLCCRSNLSLCQSCFILFFTAEAISHVSYSPLRLLAPSPVSLLALHLSPLEPPH